MWTVMDSLIDPTTGTVFSWITSDHKMSLILWHSGEVNYRPGDVIVSLSGGISTTRQLKTQSVFHIIGFKPTLWSILLSSLKCPKNNKMYVTCPKNCRINYCGRKVVI